MRKIICSEFYTLDGLFSDPDDKMEWVLNNFTDELGKYEDSLYDNADTILLGRKTYKIFEGYWPDDAPVEKQESDLEMARKINNMLKVVFSGTLEEVTWKNSILVKSIDADGIKKIKQQDGKDILLIGSSEIVQQLSSLGLIDEYHFVMLPVVLGQGKPLFSRKNSLENLALKEIRDFGNGVTGLFYKLSSGK